MSQLQRKNPQGFQTIQSLMSKGEDPASMVKQVMQNITPEQRQNILVQAKSYGAPDSILSQIQNLN